MKATGQSVIATLTLCLALGAACKDSGSTASSTKVVTSQDEAPGSVTIAVSCKSTGQDHEMCKRAVEAWSKKTGHKTKIVTVPSSSTEVLALFQQLLAAKSNDIDVFNVDVIWPGILGQHFVDLAPYTKGVEKQHFPSIIANNTVGGRLVAMPFTTDAGVLYYCKDLLEKHGASVPTTWDELTTTALAIQKAERAEGNPKLWGYVWQGKAYEGLTCNALEWIASHGGGTIIDTDGKVTVNNEGDVKALTRAAGWVDRISPPGVLNYAEEEARGVFQSGNAVFMRNWPYAWALAQGDDSPIKGKVGVAPLPSGAKGSTGAATLGGWQLGVSKYSKHPDVAADLVMYMTSAAEQKRRAIEASNLPTIESVYSDPEVLKVNPFFKELVSTFQQAVARPSSPTGARYNEVSTKFWNATHAVLSGRSSAADSLAKLETELERVTKRVR